MIGPARLCPGPGKRAVLELREDVPKSGWETNIVLEMVDGQIVSMAEYRRSSKARSVADG